MKWARTVLSAVLTVVVTCCSTWRSDFVSAARLRRDVGLGSDDVEPVQAKLPLGSRVRFPLFSSLVCDV